MIRDTPFAPGMPCWVDLLTSDTARTQEFYSALFGWTYDVSGPEFGGYITAFVGGQQVAGIMANAPDSGHPDVWATYFCTADIGASAEAVRAAGGAVVMGPDAVGELGSMAFATDPTRGAFGLWQPGTHPGYGRWGEPGAVAWTEYSATDFAAATSFYANVFGWTLNPLADSDEFRYSTGDVDGNPIAGLMDATSTLPAGVPPHWSIYFGVADTEAGLATVTERGGTALGAPADSPYGRNVTVADPTGATFVLNGPNRG